MTSRKTIAAIDVHTGGEAGRVLLDGHLWVKGADMAARLQYCREHLNDLRRLVLTEPRGYPSLLGVLVLPPVNPESDFGIIVLEQGSYTPMSGANLICAVTALVETQKVPVTEPITYLQVDTAAGTVAVRAEVSGGRVINVEIDNVPAFVVALDHVLTLPGYGEVAVDIVFGGQYYVQAPAETFGIKLNPNSAEDIIRAANVLLAVARRDVPVKHPLQPGIDHVAVPLLYGPAEGPGAHGRSTVVIPNGSPDLDDPRTWRGGTLDRSPSGTGTSARMAARFARGELQLNEPFVHESILGTTYTGLLRGETRVGDHPAVLPTISGRGWISGFHQFVIDSDDPFPAGYTLGDIWGPSQD
ncbi:proline racemase family protein [Paenarthrobacter sp. A20]|uniref:proline racemase family protein n=1 Tax=Paenarthrobacter sp. A20 TaxID=2817891 RepID=UPI00209FA2BF|nr:proline racemase family protein [Paenarthrobacter sp. A20]MCP1415544.1 proline racemase [Paenarthrobacter sp. A20]